MADSIGDALAKAGVERSPELTPLGEPPPASVPTNAGIAAAQIEPGVAALRFDPILLVRDLRVTWTREATASKLCIFVCVGVDVEATSWVKLSPNGAIGGLEIEADWRTGGNYDWRKRRLYLRNGASLWRGPRGPFASASWREVFSDAAELARLTAAGLDAVREQIEADGGSW